MKLLIELNLSSIVCGRSRIVRRPFGWTFVTEMKEIGRDGRFLRWWSALGVTVANQEAKP